MDAIVKPRAKSQSQGIMVDLDSILDTRHGTIKKHYPEAFKRLRNSPKYYLRKSDEWVGLDPDINPTSLALWYQGRDLETIKNSQLTMITRAIVDLVTELLTKIRSNDPTLSAFFFVLNVYPYRLSVELVTEIADKFLTQLGIPDAPIGFVNMPWKDLNPAFLKAENITYWYCYHYEAWMRENFEPVDGKEPSSSDKIDGACDTKMFAPMLVQNQAGIDELVGGLEEKVFVDHFTITTAVFRNLILFEFLPVAAFSTIDIERFLMLERDLVMEKSDILSTAQSAVKDLMHRQGIKTTPSVVAVNASLDEMENLLYQLRITNNEAGINVFKKTLAELNAQLMKTYNFTPFSSGADLESVMNQMSLAVDTNIEEYLVTEAYWNNKGIKTIKQMVELENGETLFRCIVADGENAGNILAPQNKPATTVKPVDFIDLGNYLYD